jgi:hypothetical protein
VVYLLKPEPMPRPSPIVVTWTSGPRRFGAAEALGFLGLLALGVAFAFPRLPWLGRLWPGCAFRAITGLPCGTCGFTRAFIRAAHLQLGPALRVSPLGFFLFVTWVASAIVIVATFTVPALPRPAFAISGKLGALLSRWGLLAALLLNWAYLVAFTLWTGSPPT